MKSLKWFSENSSRFQGRLLWNEPLAKHTYYRIGGPADLVAIPVDPVDLGFLYEGLMCTGVPSFVLGMGSNILASDEGFRGLIIKTSRISSEVVPEGDDLIRAGASVTVTSLLRHAGQRGWDGFELLAGIPGAVGGVVAMNAGTHLGEAKDLLESADVFSLRTGKLRVVKFSEESFSYRKNHFLEHDDIVCGARFRCVKADPSTVQAKISDVLLRRKASQPLEYPSCGSVFKNPAGKKAWEVIDSLGLRGHQIGQAQFSEKHSNFIVNLGDAKAADVRALIQLAKHEARTRLGIELEEEVKWVGEGSLYTA